MPYSNVPDSKQDEMERCVQKVMRDGKSKQAAIAICHASIMQGKSLADIDFELELEPENDVLISYGDSVKATPLDDGSVHLAGYLVRFSTENDPDVVGDFFTKDTDFGDLENATVYFHHRLPVIADGKRIEYKSAFSEKAKLTKDDVGIFADVIIKARNDYERIIAESGKSGYLGWSSGTASHLVDRRPMKNGANHVTKWPIGLDASLTPTPAEPRNGVVSIKSLLPSAAAAVAEPDEQKSTLSNPKESIMDENEIKAMVEKATAAAAEQAVKKFADEILPEVKAGFNVQVVADEADRALAGNPWKTAGEFFIAVKNAALQPYSIDKRLLPLRDTETKAPLGLNEATPSGAGFLVQNTVAPGIYQNMWETGTLLSRFAINPVSGNSMTLNAIDETSRVDGSRLGGVQGYWLAEAGTKQSSKPKFRQLDLKLKKVAALVYATDEQLEDAAFLGSWLQSEVPNELRFKVEDAFINGDGVGKPLGILNSPALVSFARTDANEIDAADIGKMWARRMVGYRDYIWLASPDIFPQLIQLVIGTQPVYMPPGGMSASPYGTIFGRPVIETEYNPTLGTLGDLLLMSPSAYEAIDKSGGVQTASSIHVAFTTDETAFRFVYRVDGAPILNSPVTPFKGSLTKSPFVALTASS